MARFALWPRRSTRPPSKHFALWPMVRLHRLPNVPFAQGRSRVKMGFEGMCRSVTGAEGPRFLHGARWACSCLAVGLTLMACGCDADGPPLVRVQGVVTLDGQPLAGKAVRFIPDRDTPGAGAGANTNADGAYDLIAVRPGA